MDIDHNDNNNHTTLDETLELLCVKPNTGIDVISTPNGKVTLISTPNKKGIKVKEVTKGKLTTVCPSNFTMTTVYLPNNTPIVKTTTDPFNIISGLNIKGHCRPRIHQPHVIQTVANLIEDPVETSGESTQCTSDLRSPSFL